ncbi:MAG TPA: hypothetical protein VFO58_14810 [Vicinamibacterales bacterium]|nr:hypothetical protein [Vicinamibacterales bacterium]
MRVTTRFAVVVMLMAIVGFTLSIVVPSPARGAGSAPVTVVNTPAEPVPVALQGTGSVAGTVNALQSGPWTVGVSSLPAVQLAPGTTFNLNSSPTAPIYTADVSARQAFAVSVCDGSGNSTCPSGEVAFVPVGKRFVIEQVSGRCWSNGDVPATFYIYASLNGQAYPYYTSGVQGLVGVGQTNYIIVGALTRIYAETSVGIARFDSSTEECRATLSGHLQDNSSPFPG